MQRERFSRSGENRLRCGITTGSCAAAAAKAAAVGLLTGSIPTQISIETPTGITLTLQTADAVITGQTATCAVRKDAGDDPDVTHGVLVYAAVSRTNGQTIEIDGGEGIGRVTRPGLDQPVGAAAINRVPRAMIEAAVSGVLQSGARVIISIPAGVSLAEKTYNPRLGIVGGVSVLGTSGIVEPMSEAALVETIGTELRMLRAESDAPILMTPGGYGETFSRKSLGLQTRRAVLCSNFLGDALTMAQSMGFRGVLLVSHAGKLVKVAGGIFQTHSMVADARMEILTAHAALAGAEQKTAAALLECATVDAAFDLLEQAGILPAVCQTLIEKIGQQLRMKIPTLPVEAVLFTNSRGVLGQTEGAAQLMTQIERTEENQ